MTIEIQALLAEPDGIAIEVDLTERDSTQGPESAATAIRHTWQRKRN